VKTRKRFNFQEYPEVSTIGNIVNNEGRQLSFFARGGFGDEVRQIFSPTKESISLADFNKPYPIIE